MKTEIRLPQSLNGCGTIRISKKMMDEAGLKTGGRAEMTAEGGVLTVRRLEPLPEPPEKPRRIFWPEQCAIDMLREEDAEEQARLARQREALLGWATNGAPEGHPLDFVPDEEDEGEDGDEEGGEDS